jgi:hypothetical protein
MGGSTTTEQQGSSSQVNQIPQWVQNAGQQNYGLAQQVASQPLQQYQGQMVADTSPQTQQAWNLAANSGNVGQDAQSAAQAGYLNTLGQTPQNVQAGQLSNTNLQPYMNPYTQNVINTTLPIMQQNLALQQNQQQNAANSANAFGGSRQGIQQGVTQAQGAQNMAQMAQQLNQANFGQAQAAAQNDIANTLKAQQGNQSAALQQGALANQASAGLGTLGNQQMQNNIANYGMLTSAGGFEQQQAQNDINAQLAKFQQAWTNPQQQLGMMESALGMTPYNTGSSGTSASTTTQTQSNPASMALGGLSTLGGLFSAFSDRRLKTDIQRVGKHPSGVPIYSFRYKGDPKSYPKIAGPMAEDVMKIAPHAVRPMTTKGHLAVDMSTLGALSPRRYADGASFVAPNMDDAELGSQLTDSSGGSMFDSQQGGVGQAIQAIGDAAGSMKSAMGSSSGSVPASAAPKLQPGSAHIPRPQGYAFGTPRVPGRGRQDSVHAMLTPGEAVLRPHVAQAIGRQNIAMMNALPPSSPGVARAIGALGRGGPPTPGVATPPSRSIVGTLGRRAAPRMPILGALSGR